MLMNLSRAPHTPGKPRTRRSLWTECGLSIVEMMVALGIGTIVTGTAYSVIYSSQQMQTVNEQTADTQQNSRMAMELLVQDLQAAGFNTQTLATYLPAGIGPCGINGILPEDNNAGGNDTGPDRVNMILPTSITTMATAITGLAPTPNVVLQTGAVAAAGAEGFGVNSVVSLGGLFIGTVQSVSGDTVRLVNTVRIPKTSTLPVGLPVYWLRCITYEVITSNSSATTKQPLCGGSVPCLVRGPGPCVVGSVTPCVPVVDGIEDVQIAYGCDGCTGSIPDEIIDDQPGGTANQFDANDFVSNSAWTTPPFNGSSIRLARVTVVARQTRTRLGSESVTGKKAVISAPLVIEDHNHASDAGYNATTYSQQQRRVLTRTVHLKNMGLF